VTQLRIDIIADLDHNEIIITKYTKGYQV